VGNAALDLELAGLATGPVERVWYAPGSDRLRIRTTSGKILETNDFDRWMAAPAGTAIPPSAEVLTTDLPENAAQIRNPLIRVPGCMLSAVSPIAPTMAARTGESNSLPRAVDCRR
jgi:hypothetical protein